VSTDIMYLQDLRADLMEAAARVTAPARRSFGRPPRRPVARWKLLTAAAAVFVVVAGVVGFLADRGWGGGDRAHSLAMAKIAAQASPAGIHEGPNDEFRSLFRNQGDGQFGIHVPGIPHAGAPMPAPSAAPAAIPVQGADGAPVVGPSIIKTGELEIRVERGTFPEQFQKAMSIAERYSGYVQTSGTSGTTTKSGTMTIRVPADKFALAVADLRVLGRVLHQQVTGQDVSAQVVDLGARLKNAEVQEARLRKLLSTAPTVSSTLDVNRVLSQTELLIEELQGQLRVLQNRTDLGTIHLAMEERPPKVAQNASATEPPVKNPKLGRAFDKGIAGFLGVVFSVVVGIGYLLPLLVVALIAWFVVRRIRRSRMAPA